MPFLTLRPRGTQALNAGIKKKKKKKEGRLDNYDGLSEGSP